MARIEGNNYVIESIEEAEAISVLLNQPSKINENLQKALDDYKQLISNDIKNFDLFKD